MKLLCDTSILLKMALGTVSKDARVYLEDPQHDLCYSAASVWEVAIKNKLGKLALDSLSYQSILDTAGFKHIDITRAHVQQLNGLKDIHKDPFDRIMVAQAISESMLFLTTDKALRPYHQNVIVVAS